MIEVTQKAIDMIAEFLKKQEAPLPIRILLQAG